MSLGIGDDHHSTCISETVNLYPVLVDRNQLINNSFLKHVPGTIHS